MISTKNVKSIAVFRYPDSLNSAVYGLEELFGLAERICHEQGLNTEFSVQIVDPAAKPEHGFDVVLLPPSVKEGYYLAPEEQDLQWLRDQYNRGAVVASACAGAFVLMASGLCGQRQLTTHWGLADRLQALFPQAQLNINKILIDHGDIMTAGGMMSWLDLGLQLVAKLASPAVMRLLGKVLVVDTGGREQSYYQQFSANFRHGDESILAIQRLMHDHYQSPVSVAEMAERHNLTLRTLQRRFLRLTGYSPLQYIQRIRIQRVCDLLESTPWSFELIAVNVGYEDAGACRKVFIKVMGLTPLEFRRRFAPAGGV